VGGMKRKGRIQVSVKFKGVFTGLWKDFFGFSNFIRENLGK
jgi:hypothetical protein